MTPAGQRQSMEELTAYDTNPDAQRRSPTERRVGIVLAAVNDASRRLRR